MPRHGHPGATQECAVQETTRSIGRAQVVCAQLDDTGPFCDVLFKELLLPDSDYVCRGGVHNGE